MVRLANGAAAGTTITVTPERAIQEAQAALLAGQPDVAKRVLDDALTEYPGHSGLREALADLTVDSASGSIIEAPSPIEPEQESTFQPPGFPPDFPGVPLVRSMGRSWDGLGWMLVLLNLLVLITFMVNYIPLVPKLMEAGMAQLLDSKWLMSQLPEVIHRMLTIGQVGAMLTGFWVSMDILDKRGRPTTLLSALTFSMCCCMISPTCGPAMVLIPLQMYVGRKLRWTPPKNFN